MTTRFKVTFLYGKNNLNGNCRKLYSLLLCIWLYLLFVFSINLELFLFYAHAMMLYDALHAIDRGLALV